jgi:glycosyltransferase involved in cell wall biosynthesis
VKILALADAGCTTGFGVVTHHLLERLVRDYGHEAHVLAVNFRGDAFPSTIDPGHETNLRLYLPTQKDQRDLRGLTRIVEMIERVEPDVVWTLNDPEVVLALLFGNAADRDKVLLQEKILAYLPCDGTNLPRLWTDDLPRYVGVVAMSRHGQRAYDAPLVYHGVDPAQWWPVSDRRPITMSSGQVLRTKADAKRQFGLDGDAFVVGRVDANTARKDYAALWKALVPVMKRHADVVAIWQCQSQPEGAAGGVNLVNLLSREPDLATGRFFYPKYHSSFIGWPQQDLNALVNAFDVVASPSHGEGFGLGLAEAAACGVPIIALNVSAIPEVVGPGGILLEPAGTTTTPSGEDQWLPDVPAFTDALETLYAARGARRKLGERGRAHVTASFSWDTAAGLMDGHIRRIAATERLAAVGE